MNLEGHCPAVEIRTGVEKDGNAVVREGIAATSEWRLATESVTECDPYR